MVMKLYEMIKALQKAVDEAEPKDFREPEPTFAVYVSPRWYVEAMRELCEQDSRANELYCEIFRRGTVCGQPLYRATSAIESCAPHPDYRIIRTN